MVVVVVLEPGLSLGHLKCGVIFHLRHAGFLHNRTVKHLSLGGDLGYCASSCMSSQDL